MQNKEGVKDKLIDITDERGIRGKDSAIFATQSTKGTVYPYFTPLDVSFLVEFHHLPSPFIIFSQNYQNLPLRS